jgi:hypothetical protein
MRRKYIWYIYHTPPANICLSVLSLSLTHTCTRTHTWPITFKHQSTLINTCKPEISIVSGMDEIQNTWHTKMCVKALYVVLEVVTGYPCLITILYTLNYCIYLNMTWPLLYFSVIRKIRLRNILNFLQNYKVTPHFSDDELGKNYHLILESLQYIIFLPSTQPELDTHTHQ